MSRADYAHWNEDADYMWWQEEGRHPYEPDYDNDAYTDDWYEERGEYPEPDEDTFYDTENDGVDEEEE